MEILFPLFIFIRHSIVAVPTSHTHRQHSSQCIIHPSNVFLIIENGWFILNQYYSPPTTNVPTNKVLTSVLLHTNNTTHPFLAIKHTSCFEIDHTIYSDIILSHHYILYIFLHTHNTLHTLPTPFYSPRPNYIYHTTYSNYTMNTFHTHIYIFSHHYSYLDCMNLGFVLSTNV